MSKDSLLDKNPSKNEHGKAGKGSYTNPKTVHFEFLGVFGTSILIVVLPLVVLALSYLCQNEKCLDWSLSNIDQFDFHWKGIQSDLHITQQSLSILFAVVVGWYCYLAALYYILPSKQCNGTLLRDGKTMLSYPSNGFHSLVVTLLLLAIVALVKGPSVFLFVSEHYTSLMISSMVFAFMQSIYLYSSSFVGDKMLSLGGNSDSHIYNFFMGRELNPRIGGFDLKYFCELRPGMIGWLVINLSFAVQQYIRFGKLTDSMLLVVFFEAWYVVDALYNEASVLTTMDITTDGFGFMLSFGDLSWVPFTFTLQAKYLSWNPVTLGWQGFIGIICLQLLGYWIFRSANKQKDLFRSQPNHPSVKNLSFIQTEAGSKLITSGWWGTARHINYLGDWIMGISWCLPCGFQHPVPYFYVIYFGILLLHRERRDEHKCRMKYKKDWETYCSIVPNRIIPYVY